jgi:atypical dual specificity phosphatase
VSERTKSSFCAGAVKGDRTLFAMTVPGLLRPLEDDLVILIDNGVGAIVTLTEDPIFIPLPFRERFKLLHLPVENMEPPTLKQVIRFVEFVDAEFDRGVNVAVHCLMGIGRTGTMIAAYRVSMGEGPAEAIDNLRKIRRFIETKEQEEMVHKYYKHLQKHRRKK